MSITRVSKQTKRSRPKARLAFPARETSRPFDDIVASQMMAVKIPVIPPEQTYLTEHEAWTKGLISLGNIAILSEIPYYTWSNWSREFRNSGFPEMVGTEYQVGGCGHARLYDARRLQEWYHQALAKGLVRPYTSRRKHGL